MEGFPTSVPSMDSKMDVDVGKPAEPHRLSLTQDSGSIPTLDGWIESLMKCKQLSENDVSRLCDRVCDCHFEGRDHH
jgi:serine/threonine-protein phosphatase 2A catalytic subunit